LNNIGIIAEYNPFHKGHLYHLDETIKQGKADHIVAVMSGNFTQRGEPAIYDKWVRAEMAVRNGVDIVFELPFIFACNNAEYFSSGAVSILNSLGCISHFSFGSEGGSLPGLLKTARLLTHESDGFKESIKGFLDSGLSYPRARFEALKETEGEDAANLIRNPNNILGVEYLKQWIITDSHMEPMTIKRLGMGYHDLDIKSEFASATAIRKAIGAKEDMEVIGQALPKESLEIISKRTLDSITEYGGLFPLIAYKILSSSNEELAQILSGGEGLENRLRSAVKTSCSVEEIIRLTISKRYTETRIKRLLIHTLTGLTREKFFHIYKNPPLYARLLGFSPRGAKLLRHIKKTKCSQIPIISNISKEATKDMDLWEVLKFDILSSDIYNLAFGRDIYKYSDYVLRPFCQDTSF
jgi:predicted nucleotidyltransferase